jgi:hypothetical protein
MKFLGARGDRSTMALVVFLFFMVSLADHCTTSTGSRGLQNLPLVFSSAGCSHHPARWQASFCRVSCSFFQALSWMNVWKNFPEWRASQQRVKKVRREKGLKL